MSSGLEDALVRRFDALESAIPDSMQARNEAIRVLARECLRQMEWARRERYKPLREYPRDDARIIGWAPLTLAPEDWKP